jgi:hypothetical protein
VIFYPMSVIADLDGDRLVAGGAGDCWGVDCS